MRREARDGHESLHWPDLGGLFLRDDKPAIRKALLRLRYLDKFAEEARARRTNLERVECMTLLEIHEPGETPLPHAGEGSLAVGIDLGTTNSVVAIAREGKPAALHDETGAALVPSVVAYPRRGRRAGRRRGASADGRRSREASSPRSSA